MQVVNISASICLSECMPNKAQYFDVALDLQGQAWGTDDSVVCLLLFYHLSSSLTSPLIRDEARTRQWPRSFDLKVLGCSSICNFGSCTGRSGSILLLLLRAVSSTYGIIFLVGLHGELDEQLQVCGVQSRCWSRLPDE